MDTFAFILLAAIGGIAVTLQGQFMGIMDQAMGTRASVLITYASGGALVLVYTLLRGVDLTGWRGVPWYAFGAGVFGLVIVATIGYVIPRLGVANGFTLIVASQFFIAALIDHFGWFQAVQRPMDLTRLLGFGVMLIGVWLVTK